MRQNRFLPQVKSLFVQVLVLAREMKCLKLGTIALDGTKVHANASKHKALSWAHANKIEAQLREEIQTRPPAQGARGQTERRLDAAGSLAE